MTTYKMDTEHAESVFTNASISTPVNPTTNQPLNQFERPYLYNTREAWLSHSSPDNLTMLGTTRTEVAEEVRDHPDSNSVLDREMRNCEALAKDVNEVQRNHCTTTAILEQLYKNQQRLNEVATTLLDNCKQVYSLSSMSEPLCHHDDPSHGEDHRSEEESVDYATVRPHPPLATSSTISLSSIGKDAVDTSTDSYDGVDEFEHEFSSDSSCNDGIGSYGLEKIDTMWDGFSVDDYVPSSSWKPTPDEVSKSTWQPRITIPKPFEMTLREEQKEKKKTKSQIEAERAEIEKQALEEAELSKKFRANPIPATTHLPLYEMIQAQNERRRQYVKENSHKILKSKEKPFSFVSRELKRLAVKQEELARQMEEEHKQVIGEMFKARPIPRHVLDPDVNEKQKENEYYRSIRIRMRALELLANSHLPNRMRYGDEKYSDGHLRKLRQEEVEKMAFLTREHSFHPMINQGMPNHRRAYEDFQQQLQERKEEENWLTVAEPFTHRTHNRIMERQSKPRASTTGPTVKQSKTMNDKERQLLQREVSQKSIVNDVAFAMDVHRRDKLRKLKSRDRKTANSYDQQLAGMKDRVRQRPLLFETVGKSK